MTDLRQRAKIIKSKFFKLAWNSLEIASLSDEMSCLLIY